MQKSIPPSTAAGYTSNSSARVDVESKTTKHPMVETSEPQVNATSPAIATRTQDTSRNYPQATDVDRDANVSLSDQGEVESAHFIQEMSLQFPEANNSLSSVFSAIGAIGNTIGRATLRSRKIAAFLLSTNFIVFANTVAAAGPPFTADQFVAFTESPLALKQKMSDLERAQHIIDIILGLLVIVLLVAYAIYKRLTLLQTHEMNDSQIEMSGNTADVRVERAKTEMAEQLKKDAADPNNDYPEVARSMLPEMTRSFVEQAIKFVPEQQLKEAEREAFLRMILLIISGLSEVIPSIVNDRVLERLHEEFFGQESGSISKEETAELAGNLARNVSLNEGSDIAQFLLAKLPNRLHGKVGGHVTLQKAREMVQDAVREELEEGGQATRLAEKVNIMISLEFGNAGVPENYILVAAVSGAAVTKDEATNVIIQVIEEEFSELMVPLVSELVDSAAQNIDGMDAQDFQEISKAHMRVNGTSFRDDFLNRLESSEPEQNRTEEQTNSREVWKSKGASSAGVSEVFVSLGLCALLLSPASHAIFWFIERS